MSTTFDSLIDECVSVRVRSFEDIGGETADALFAALKRQLPHRSDAELWETATGILASGVIRQVGIALNQDLDVPDKVVIATLAAEMAQVRADVARDRERRS